MDLAGGLPRTATTAEVIGWQELLDVGGYVQAKDKGLLRIEGRDYVMQDGDIISVRFTP